LRLRENIAKSEGFGKAAMAAHFLDMLFIPAYIPEQQLMRKL